MGNAALAASSAKSATQDIKLHRPKLFVATTEQPRTPTGKQAPLSGDYDILAQTLQAIRLTGSVFLNARFSKPFGVISPDRFDANSPLAHLHHVSVFHLMASGSCTIETETGERHTVSAGDIILMPFATAHKLWNGDGSSMAFAPDLMRPGTVEGLWTVDHGGGGETTRMVCGFVESREFLYAPVFRSLPSVLIDRTGNDRVSALITSTVREILLLADTATPGTELMLGRLMELLFVEVVRRYASRLPPGAQGWFAALNDRIVGRALRSIHHDPARRWTVDELAREAGTSRSVLSERFTSLLGQPPVNYLTAWRMQLAAERLRNTDSSLAAIAAGVGYQSEAAFNRAFKRFAGLAPGCWREAEAADRGHASASH
jgi:AraC-like DNA-binding protein/mannose-6-phosphate isomerase-like protein (cupin superfamily)